MEVNTPVFSSPPAASPGTPGALMEKEIPPSLPPAGAVLTEPPGDGWDSRAPHSGKMGQVKDVLNGNKPPSEVFPHIRHR